MEHQPFLTNNAVIFGVLAIILGAVFWTSDSGGPFFRRFYRIFPPLLLCYFLPSLLNTFGIVGEASIDQLWFVSSRYLLPAALILLTASADLPTVFSLGPKAIILFFTGTIGVIIGGPAALFIASVVNPDMLGVEGPDAVWRGMTTLAGSWIGGGANQAAMKEIYGAGDDIFSVWVTVDIIVANIWVAILLTIAAHQRSVDRWLRADRTALDRVRVKAEAYEAEHARIPVLKDFIFILAIAFGGVAVAHFSADRLAPYFQTNFPQWDQLSVHSAFFWLVVVVTALGVGLSFSPARKLQGAGAMKIGSVFVYILVASVGLRMNILALADAPFSFFMGLIWVSVHAGLLIIMTILLRAPSFFMAVGSQANIGGAASAPVVAAAFHPSLAPVGALLAVVGYAAGTFGAWLTGQILQAMSG